MSGLEQIIEKIVIEAELQCSQIQKDAEEKAAGIVADAEADGIALEKELIAQAEQEAEGLIAKARSGAQMERSKCILHQKNKMMEAVVQEAKTRLQTLPDQEYFQAIQKLVVKHALPQEGRMLLSSGDMGRLPAGYEAAINDGLSGGSLTITPAEAAALSSGGFILVYGDIELNLTFEALFEDEKDACKDLIYTTLFAG